MRAVKLRVVTRTIVRVNDADDTISDKLGAISIVILKLAHVSDDGEKCGEKCQFLHGSTCRMNGTEELEFESSRTPTRSSQCRDSEEERKNGRKNRRSRIRD